MSSLDRIVTVVPMQVFWTDDGELSAARGRWLNRGAIRELLRSCAVRFVVAKVGHRLRWIPLTDRFEFWKTEVVIHLSDTEQMYLDDFSDGVAYAASGWRVAESEPPIVLLEVHH